MSAPATTISALAIIAMMCAAQLASAPPPQPRQQVSHLSQLLSVGVILQIRDGGVGTACEGVAPLYPNDSPYPRRVTPRRL